MCFCSCRGDGSDLLFSGDSFHYLFPFLFSGWLANYGNLDDDVFSDYDLVIVCIAVIKGVRHSPPIAICYVAHDVNIMYVPLLASLEFVGFGSCHDLFPFAAADLGTPQRKQHQMLRDDLARPDEQPEPVIH